MPSCLPVKPSFSVVVALMEILSSSVLRTFARHAFMAGIWGFILGFISFCKQYLAVYIESIIGVVGEMESYVAHVGSAEHGIADGVYEHVGIAMPEQSLFMLYEYATHP